VGNLQSDNAASVVEFTPAQLVEREQPKPARRLAAKNAQLMTEREVL
jgi:hypothetical protein